MAQIKENHSPVIEKKVEKKAVSIRNFGRILGVIIILRLLLGLPSNLIPTGLNERFQTFVTIFLAIFVGSLLGFAFPVCECRVVPVTRWCW
jgi:hypothetical protein